MKLVNKYTPFSYNICNDNATIVFISFNFFISFIFLTS